MEAESHTIVSRMGDLENLDLRIYMFFQPVRTLGLLWVVHRRTRKKTSRLPNVYLGENFNSSQITEILISNGLKFEELADDKIAARTAELLNRGFIIGFFNGRFEFGPRALGNRSILADPRRKETKRKVNESVKFRELFRPFAPVVTFENARKYFELTDDELNSDLYKYMLSVTSVKDS